MANLQLFALFVTVVVAVSGTTLGVDDVTGGSILQATVQPTTGRTSLLRDEKRLPKRRIPTKLEENSSLLEGRHQGQENRIRQLENEVAELRRTLKEITSESETASSSTDDVRLPTKWEDGSSRSLSLAERLRYLERKVAGSSNWLRDPQLWRKTQYICRNMTDMGSHGEHHVCLDGWEKQLHKVQDQAPCIVYDLGIRAQPQFGQTMMKDYGCSVRAYDPSSTTAKWWDSSEAAQLRAAGEKRYKLHKVAAGGQDGPLELFEYNWQQVSIVKEERDLTRNKMPKVDQRSFQVQSKTLPSMLQENGDTRMNVLKVDIEGSEYMFLQDVFDRMGCPPAGQITLEYHHFSLDERYGSSPEINTIHHLLNACGFKSFMVRDHWKNHVTPEDPFYISPKRYTLASYCRDCLAEI